MENKVMDLNDIINFPLMTESASVMVERDNKLIFIVNLKAGKSDVKKAVEELYGVDVESVNTMFYSGKNKSRFTKAGVISGRTSAYKKAIVTLAKGETIDFYSNI